MTSTPVSPSNIAPTANNILMEVDSNLEAEQVAQEVAQAQDQVCATKEAQERHWEEWKRREEEEEV